MKHYRIAIALGLVALAVKLLGLGERQQSPQVNWETVSIEGLRPNVTLKQLERRFGKPRVSEQGYVWKWDTGEQAVSVTFSQEGDLCRLSGNQLMLSGKVIAKGDSEYGRRLVKRLSGERYKPRGYQSQLERVLGPGQAFDTQTNSPRLCTAYDASGRDARCTLLVERILRPHEDEKDAITEFVFVWHQNPPSTALNDKSLTLVAHSDR